MAKYDFPTEVIDLPSKGKLYPESNPLSKGTVEIKYMTAKEEDILASQNLIKKGVVLDKLFESVVVDAGVDVGDIFIGDKNAILLATRILGYGKDYQVEMTDPTSGEKQKVNIDLSKVQVKEVVEDTLNSENRYEFDLPLGKKKIIFRLLTHKDEIDINAEIQALNRLTKGDVVSQDVTTRLRYMIQDVGGNEDRAYINNFVKNSLLARDSRALRKYIQEFTPDLDLTFNFVSDVTGEQEALDIPFGIGFFTLPNDYSIQLHSQIWEMVNYGNGFTWSEVYFMPIHWRNFYFKKLLEAKKKEKEEHDKSSKKKGVGHQM